jgi:NADH:ubiquinone oxidoreductase subunit 3 (subunit A)
MKLDSLDMKYILIVLLFDIVDVDIFFFKFCQT